MKRWAVGYYDYDNGLTVEIVSGPTWVDAVKAHSNVSGIVFDPTDLEEAKEDFFNCDAAIDCVEIP